MPMKSKRNAAIRTVARFTAIAAKQRRGKSASIQKEDCLFTLFETIGDRLRQPFGQNRGGLFFPAFLAKIDNAHQRHLLFIHPLGKSSQSIFAGSRVVITLERRRGADQNQHTFLYLRAHDGDIARVIPGRFLLLVSCLVFFIDNDQSKVFQRREHCAAGADHNLRAAGMNFVPFIVAFALG